MPPARLTRLARAIAALLAAAALSLSAATTPARADSGGPYAIHSMLQLSSPYVFKQAMFAAAAAAGASEIRVDASLGALNNPWIDTAMWQGLSDYMRLSQRYALPVLLDLNANNDISLETCQPGVDPSTGLCGISDLNGYYNEVAAVVRYTRGVIDDFEIVNEPDGSWAFTGTPQQYAGMLATAYAAVHDNDAAGRVVLGGIMSPWDTAWLNAVFTTPGYGAAHTFDVANVHLRDTLANLPGEVTAWHRYFTFFGDGTLPLWVTETGYPSDPAYQYDASFRGSDSASGQAAQAAFLAKSLPSLVVAGAARVFVTERDDLAGQFASEGLLGGHVTDGDESNPNPIPKPAYATFQQLVAQAAAALAAPPPPAAPPTAPPAPSTDAPVSTSPPPTASPPAVAASAAAPAARSAHRRPARIAGHGRPAAERHRKRPGRRLRTRRHRPRG